MRACMLGVAVVLLAALVSGAALGQESSPPATPAAPAVQPQYNADPVAEFGTAKSEPIDTGFFFFDGKYIEAPYVVERRGLDTYINDCLVRKGPEWPPYDYRVNEDPGDPPADESPLGPVSKGVDGRNTYWARKTRYLFQHYDGTRARELLIAAYKSSSAVADVAVEGETADPSVTDKYGKTAVIDMMVPPMFLSGPPSRGEILRRAEHDSAYMSRSLTGTRALFMTGGLSVEAMGDRAIELIGVLVSHPSLDDRIAALKKLGVIPEGNAIVETLFRSVSYSPQLLSRYDALREHE